MTRTKSVQPKRLPPPRALASHRAQLPIVTQQLLRALHAAQQSPSRAARLLSASPCATPPEVRHIVRVVLDAATAATAAAPIARSPPPHAPPRAAAAAKNAPSLFARAPARMAAANRVPPSPSPSPPRAHMLRDDELTDDELLVQPSLPMLSQLSPAPPRAASQRAAKRVAKRAASRRAARPPSPPPPPPPPPPARNACVPAARRAHGAAAAAKRRRSARKHAQHAPKAAQQPPPPEDAREAQRSPPQSRRGREHANDPHSDISSDVDMHIENTACSVCSELGDYARMVLCDACASGCHIYCMQPRRSSIPLGTWLCPSCHIVAKRHHIHLSQMVVLREQQRCYECVSRDVSNYNHKAASKTCADCRLVFHVNCLRRLHKLPPAAIQRQHWTCSVCLAAQHKSKQQEAAMLATQRARLAHKRASAKRPRLAAPYLARNVLPPAPAQRVAYRNSKPSTFVATSLPPPRPLGNQTHFESPPAPTVPHNNQHSPSAADRAQQRQAAPMAQLTHPSPRSRLDVSISTDDRINNNLRGAYGTAAAAEHVADPMHAACTHPGALAGISQSRTTSIPLINSAAEAHTSTIRRQMPSAARAAVPSLPKHARHPPEQPVADEITTNDDVRHQVREWNQKVQSSVNDMFRYNCEPSPNNRAPIVTSAKSMPNSKPVTPEDAIPAAIYDSNVSLRAEQQRTFSTMPPARPPARPPGSNRAPTDFIPHNYPYGGWQAQRPPSHDADPRQEPRGYHHPRDPDRYVPPPQRSPYNAPLNCRPSPPDDQHRSRQLRSPPVPMYGMNGSATPLQPPSHIPQRNQAPEMYVYPSRNRAVPPGMPFDPNSVMPPYAHATQMRAMNAPARFNGETPLHFSPQNVNPATRPSSMPALNERNAMRKHEVGRSSRPIQYAAHANNGETRAGEHRTPPRARFSESRGEQAAGSAPSNIPVDNRLNTAYGVNGQRSDTCDAAEMVPMLGGTQSKRPVMQSQSSGQAALMRAALTQAANHVGYSQSVAQNGSATRHANGAYQRTGKSADQIGSSKGYQHEHGGRTADANERQRASNADMHVEADGGKSNASVDEKGNSAQVNSAPLSPAPLQESPRGEEAHVSKPCAVGASSVVQTQEEPKFVESGGLRAWIMLNICPRKRFHGSMFLDMPYRSYFSGAVRVLYDESRSLRVVAFSKFDCETSRESLKQWWMCNRSHFSLAPEHFPEEATLTAACLSKGFRLDAL